MPGPHDKAIADAAKASLGPLGFQRKGRSRLWLADHAWWLAVVEFQPSQWSKGSYLNVATHWLWSDLGSVSFDFGGRLAEFVEYKSDAQFVPAVRLLAETAAREAQRLAEIFNSVSATAKVLLADARAGARGERHPGWMAYNAGVAAGLAGNKNDAMEMFERVLDGSVPPASALHVATEHMAQLARDPVRMKREVVATIEHQRDAMRLKPLDVSPI
jgi:hypothetical protein